MQDPHYFQLPGTSRTGAQFYFTHTLAVKMQALRSASAAQRAACRPSVNSRRAALLVRAEAAPPAAGAPAAAPKKKAPPAPWKQPELDPDTPSPIFGGSTGGLLRKAQVRERAQACPPLICHAAAPW